MTSFTFSAFGPLLVVHPFLWLRWCHVCLCMHLYSVKFKVFHLINIKEQQGRIEIVAFAAAAITTIGMEITMASMLLVGSFRHSLALVIWQVFYLAKM